jgi:hypothetical protein
MGVGVDPVDHQRSDEPDRSEPVDPVLRAKYVDFCSAQLTEVFLSLSDERIYDLVEEAALAADLHPGSLGFKAMVRLVTQKLRDSVPLPDFQVWSEEYRANPERYDVYLMGLWEESLPADAAGNGSGV